MSDKTKVNKELLNKINKLKYPTIFMQMLTLLPNSKVKDVGEKELIHERYEQKRRRLYVAKYIPYCLAKHGLINKDSKMEEDFAMMDDCFQDAIDMGLE